MHSCRTARDLSTFRVKTKTSINWVKKRRSKKRTENKPCTRIHPCMCNELPVGTVNRLHVSLLGTVNRLHLSLLGTAKSCCTYPCVRRAMFFASVCVAYRTVSYSDVLFCFFGGYHSSHSGVFSLFHPVLSCPVTVDRFFGDEFM